jgi:hypothetical protein
VLIIRLAILFSLCFVASSQTNLPTPPNVTMGMDVAYEVQCDQCERIQRLVPVKVKVHRTKKSVMGKLQTATATFKCINPKCGKLFDDEIDRHIQAPRRLPPRLVVQTTNAPVPSPTTAPKLTSPKHE